MGLDASDGTSTVSVLKTDYITVLPMLGRSAPMLETFESYSSLPDMSNWFINNEDGSYTWELDNSQGYFSNKSVKMNNHSNTDGARDELLSSTIDMNFYTGMTLSFRYAYARRPNGTGDKLSIFVSGDCGKTWSYRGAVTAPTAPDQWGPYKPSSASEWVYVEKTIPDAYSGSNLRLKFVFDSDKSNNLYLDDINIDGVLGIESQELISGSFTISPNPANDRTTVYFTLAQDALVSLMIYDVTGRLIETFVNSVLSAGEFRHAVEVSTLPSGIYLLDLTVDGIRHSRQLAVE